MSVAKLNNSRLTLVRGNGKKASNRRRKKPDRQSSEVFISLFKKICVSGMCLLLLAFVGVGCLAGYRWVTSHSYFALKDISVTGNNRLSYGEILDIAGIGLNRNSLSVNIGEVERKLSESPWIESAAIKRELPRKLYVHIKERTPEFMVRQGQNLWYCDAEGELISPVEPGKFSSLPYLDIDSEAMEQTDILKDFMTRLDRRTLPFDPGQIAWIKLRGGNRMEFFIDRLGLTVELGLKNWQKQLSHLNVVWRDLQKRGEFRNIAAISAGEGRVWVEKKTSGGS
ncbi:cell division protein FtsQ/DivIB [Maridesulfovibrio bastinii]|uniref:cell division protein FtsQ/DivIB n=1 Tax=Maridesulfovibrio bastinii TaxID=47157 RepID=UPI0003FAC0DD|nr:FtsQ-type POTRA domain-containing protein [Maridesulfovibrio bastinii]